MKVRLPGTYPLSLIGGIAVGVLLGEKAFPGLEKILGDPLCDMVLGVGGAIVGGLAHELVASFYRAE